MKETFHLHLIKMGTIFSRFRKKKTRLEALEELTKKIKDIEKYGLFTEQRHKKIVGTLIAYSVILYVIAAITCYFYFFPTSPYDQLIYITPLLVFPILILFVKKLVSWYYKRKLRRSEDKLSTMQQEKKKILDEVIDHETFHNAREILLIYAPEQLRVTHPSVAVTSPTIPCRPSTPQRILPPLSSASGLRRRALTSSNVAQSDMLSNAGSLSSGVIPSSPFPASPFNSSIRAINAPTTGPIDTPLPRPILPQERSYLDRLVDYLVGDGPSNRFALICHQCGSHNGMSLKEEFEYFAFRCCYCNFWNPARKQKPSAPKLEPETNILSPSLVSAPLTISNVANSCLQPVKLNDDTEGSSTPSETDSDIEVVEKPVETPENEVLEEEDKGEVDDCKNVEETKGNKEAKSNEEVKSDEEVKEESLSEQMDVDQSPIK